MENQKWALVGRNRSIHQTIVIATWKDKPSLEDIKYIINRCVSIIDYTSISLCETKEKIM